LIETVEQEQKEKAIAENPSLVKDVVNNPSSWWPKAAGADDVGIPVYMVPAIANNARKSNAIRAAIAQFQQKTCINFQLAARRPSTNTHHIEIINDGGCYSFLGLTKSPDYPGHQPVSIGNGCGYLGIVIHEFMHALGFYHEQSRPDRDDHITVQTQNIVPRFVGQFRKVSASAIESAGEAYDIGSVMHYGPTAFSRNGQPTITRRNGQSYQANRDGFSASDLRAINKIYKCNAPKPPTPTPPTPTPPTPGPPAADGSCKVYAQLGLCDWRSICSKCGKECSDENIEPLLTNARSYTKCNGWAKRGYCNPQKKGYRSVVRLCKKTCLLYSHFKEADGPCAK
jgi:hypothetical protein